MHETTRLAPPRASVIAIIAVVITAAVGALAWTPRRPVGADAWAEHALTVTRGSFPYRFASRLDDSMRVLPVLAGSLAIALVAWLLLRRWDAVIASLVVAPVTAANEQLLKLAGRRSLGVAIFTFPSGRAALATSLVLLLVLVLRAAGVRPVVRALVGILGFVYVLAVAWARVATGGHDLTDVVGAMSMGVAVTLVTLLMLTAWRQTNSMRTASELEAVAARCGASSFSPAVPPGCHKQRSPAVSSGQPRSLEGRPWAGRRLLTLGWGRRPKLHGCKGSCRRWRGHSL